eukprot:4605150-Prymnesium_polylepis.1
MWSPTARARSAASRRCRRRAAAPTGTTTRSCRAARERASSTMSPATARGCAARSRRCVAPRCARSRPTCEG